MSRSMSVALFITVLVLPAVVENCVPLRKQLLIRTIAEQPTPFISDGAIIGEALRISKNFSNPRPSAHVLLPGKYPDKANRMAGCTIADLKELPSLTGVPEAQLQWLLDAGECRAIEAGTTLIAVNDRFVATQFILAGRYSVYFQQGRELNEVEQVERGHVLGYLPFSRALVSIIQVICVEAGSVLEVPTTAILQAIKLHFELTAALVHTMLSRIRFATTQQQQVEKMFALGKLSAGLAHELNNPAAAIVRNASTLVGFFANTPALLQESASLELDASATAAMRALLVAIRSRQQDASLSLLQRSEKEDSLGDWLISHEVKDFSLAEMLATEGFGVQDLEQMAERREPAQLGRLLHWLQYHLTTGRIANEIEAAAGRIAELVSAVKQFSHMDRGSDKQWIKVQAGLDSTLTLLDYKVRKAGIEVVRQYSIELPQILAMPGELNQVWTNLMDNAIDAMSEKGAGTLTISTTGDTRNVFVTISDDGPGIPPEVLPKIFDPFFTTKPMGQGTGLGLEVVARIIREHRGKITVQSHPGMTAFTVCLPIN
jgi:signal transduction histidine kinase